MRLYRCLACATVFGIVMKRGKNNKGGKGLSCPLCSSQKCEELDVAHELGGEIMTKALEWWKNR